MIACSRDLLFSLPFNKYLVWREHQAISIRSIAVNIPLAMLLVGDNIGDIRNRITGTREECVKSVGWLWLI